MWSWEEEGAYGDDVAVAPGMTSPPRKMEPTESMNASIPPSLPPFSCPFPRLFEGWFDPWEGGASFIRGFGVAEEWTRGSLGG